MFEQQQNQAINQQPPQAPSGQSVAPPPVSVNSGTGGKGRTIGLTAAVIILVLAGVGFWWYFAYGQTMLLVKDAQWPWGQESLKNYKQTTQLSLSIEDGENDGDDFSALGVFGKSSDLTLNSQQSFVGSDSEGDFNISLSTGQDFDMDIGLDFKIVRNQYYAKLKAKNLEQLTGGLIPLPEGLVDTWIEIPLDATQTFGGDKNKALEELELDDDKIIKVHQEINIFLQNIKDKKVFKVKDTGQMEGSSKKIKFILNPEKLDDFMLEFTATQKRMMQVLYGVDYQEVSQDKIDEMKVNFQKFQKEKPEEWQRLKEDLSRVDLFVFINPDTKNVMGAEIMLEDLRVGNTGSEMLLSGQLKYILSSIDAYPIIKPQNVKNFEELWNDFMSINSPDVDMIDSDGDGLPDAVEEMYGTDADNPDSDGDGYTDGEEVTNGYNPLGEGELVLPTGNDWDINAFSNTSSSEVVCADSGGEWILASNMSEEECNIYDEWSSCDDAEGCQWDFSVEPTACLPETAHCLCPDGSSIWPDDNGVLFFGCWNQ